MKKQRQQRSRQLKTKGNKKRKQNVNVLPIVKQRPRVKFEKQNLKVNNLHKNVEIYHLLQYLILVNKQKQEKKRNQK